MKPLLIVTAILVFLIGICGFFYKNYTQEGCGVGNADELFEIDRPFLQVVMKLTDEKTGIAISEASGCKIIQSTLIKKEKDGRIRHIISERTVEIDIAGKPRRIRLRSEVKANIREGWIVDVSEQIEPDEIIRKQKTETRITRVGFGVGSKTRVEMHSHVVVKGVPSVLLNMGIASGLAKSRAEFLRQMR